MILGNVILSHCIELKPSKRGIAHFRSIFSERASTIQAQMKTTANACEFFGSVYNFEILKNLVVWFLSITLFMIKPFYDYCSVDRFCLLASVVS